jgi:hypothetical protein
VRSRSNRPRIVRIACYTFDMKRRPKEDMTWEDSEVLLPGLLEPDPSDMDRVHEVVASGRLVDVLTNIAGLADARDPDGTALLNAINPPSRREH